MRHFGGASASIVASVTWCRFAFDGAAHGGPDGNRQAPLAIPGGVGRLDAAAVR